MFPANFMIYTSILVRKQRVSQSTASTVLMVRRGGGPNTDRVPGAATTPMAKWSRVSPAFAVQVLAAHLAKWLAWICCSVQLAYKHFQPCCYAGRGFYKVDRRLAFFNNAQRAPEKPMCKSTCHCAMPWSVLGKICTTDLWNEKEKNKKPCEQLCVHRWGFFRRLMVDARCSSQPHVVSSWSSNGMLLQ